MTSKKSIQLLISDSLGISEYYNNNNNNSSNNNIEELFGFPFFTLVIDVDIFRLDQIS